MTTKALKKYREILDSCIPRKDTLTEIVATGFRRAGLDASLAPIWAEQLRHTYTKVFEYKYPELAAANGDVLPIDSSVPPEALETEYFAVDSVGSADWIDDDGNLMPSSAITAQRFTAKMAEMGHEFSINFFDAERASAVSKPSLNLLATYQAAAKKAHDRFANWIWLFGDSSKEIPGLFTHPNITVSLAPLNGGSTSREWSAKTVDEIAADVELLIATIANDTIGAYFAAKVFMSRAMYHRLRSLRLGSGDGFASCLGLLEDRYKGDASGQGKVTFHILNECDADLRKDPRPGAGTDTSGLTGDFALALPAAPKDEMCFVRARNYTQKPPQEERFKMLHLTHSKIGGFKCQIPTAVHLMAFSPGAAP